MSKDLLLKSLGLDEDTLSNLTEENIGEAQTKLTDSIKSKLLESEDFYNSLDKSKLPKEWSKEHFDQGFNKVNGQAKSNIDKHFGITGEDKTKFNDDEKRELDKYIAKAASIYKEKVGNANSDINGLQDENLSLKKRLSELEESQQTLSDKFASELNEKLTAKEMETLALIDASGLQNNVPISINLIWDKLYNGVKSKYSVILENGIPQVRKKDNVSFKIENPDKKGEYLNLKDVLAAELKLFGAWKEEAKTDSTQQRTTVTVTPNKNNNFSEKIRKKIDEENSFLGLNP
jgi:hypothetical protein